MAYEQALPTSPSFKENLSNSFRPSTSYSCDSAGSVCSVSYDNVKFYLVKMFTLFQCNLKYEWLAT